MASLASLVKSRRESGGSITGSLSYGFKERIKESFDPRRMINQDGLLTALFPKLRSYKAGTKRIKGTKSIADTSPLISPSEPILESIKQNTRIFAKNSLVMPSMARDIFVMNKNIKQLVKSFGGKPKESAGEWLARQAARETAYESGLGPKPKIKKDTKPTPDKDSKEETKGFFGTILSMISKLPIIAKLTAGLSALGKSIAIIGGSVAGIVGVVALVGGVFVRLLKVLAKSPLAWVVAAIGAGALLDKWNSIKDSFSQVGDAVKSAQNISGDTLSSNSTGGNGGSVENQSQETNNNPKTETSTAGTVSKGMKAVGISQDTGNKLIGGAAVASGVVTAKSAVKFRGVNKVAGSKILDARTMSSEFLKKSATNKITGGIVKAGEKIGSTAGKMASGLTSTSVWRKFLEFVARKSPTLFAKIGVRLAQAGVLATIPVVGWIGAAISLGFNLWMAYELYQLWKEFNNEDVDEKSPSQVSSNNKSIPDANKAAMSPSKTKNDIAIAQNKEKLNKVNDYVSKQFGLKTIDGMPGSRKMTRSELRSEAEKLYGYDKDLGKKLNQANAEVRTAKSQSQRPQVNVTKNEKTKLKPPTPSVGSDLSQASVYDVEFLNQLGMSSFNLGQLA